MNAYQRLRRFGFSHQQAWVLARAGYDVMFIPASAVGGLVKLAAALVLTAASLAALVKHAHHDRPVPLAVAPAVAPAATFTRASRGETRSPLRVAPGPLAGRRAPVRHATRNGATVWDRLATCESSGDWQANTGNGFYGGLQFTASTWRSFGGLAFAVRADLAARWQQIVVAQRVLAGQGWAAWPACSVRLGLR